MRIQRIFTLFMVLGFILSLNLSLTAEDGDETIKGSFMLGYRSVDTNGAMSKYKEDFNLSDGMRLFNFNLHYTPGEKYQKLFDRMDINVYNFGGDPYETMGLSLQKYGKYKLQYNRRKANYFYEDLQEIGGGHLYDMHTYNFDRVMDSGLLKVWLHKNVDVYVNFDRYTKTGESTTSFDINRIEFELDKPVKEESTEISLGVDLHTNRYSLLFEERILDYENSNSIFLPGFADGGAGARYPSSLNTFYLNQPYKLKSNNHTLKFNARPFDFLLLNGSALISDQDMDLTYSEEVDGINYLNRFFSISQSGNGTFDRKFKLYNLDTTLLLMNRLAFVGAVRYSDFEQDGAFTNNGVTERSAWYYDTLGFEGGLQYQFTPKLALTAGYRNEVRQLDGHETVTYEDKTNRQGFFGNMKWDIGTAFKMTADYQRGTYDDPYTLISPTAYYRLRVTARLKIEQVNLTASYLTNKSENEVYDDLWNSSKEQFNLRLGYYGERATLSGGYSRIRIEHKADRMIAYPPGYSGPPGTFPWDIFFEGESQLGDASFSFKVNDGISLGAYANSYSNNGFWQISRLMFKAYAEYSFPAGYVAQIGYRYLDFEEKNSGLNDYTANILELSFGYRWK